MWQLLAFLNKAEMTLKKVNGLLFASLLFWVKDVASAVTAFRGRGQGFGGAVGVLGG